MTQQRGHDRRDTQIQRAVHVARESLKWVRFFGFGRTRFVGHSCQDIQGDGTLQCLTVGKAAVQRSDPDAGAAGDVVERRIGALFDEDVSGGGNDQLAVAHGVGAQRPPSRFG